LSFTPDFRGSDNAVNRVLSLPCYKDARTILVTCDNSLERLRCQALKDGKKVLVGTYRLRRGFLLLDPGRIGDADFSLAACLDGMEKPGIGRAMSVAQLRDESLRIDMCAIGGLIFNHNGVVIHEGQALFEVQWALLHDIKLMSDDARVVAIAHTCQVIDEASLSMETFIPSKSGEVQCDYVVTPDTIYEVQGAVKPASGINFKTVDPEALNNIPPLQELKGIRTMEQIMASGGFGQETEKMREEPKAPSAEEQMGMDMVAKIMKGYKA
jgi:5-formyltetrahydrofolate cyclo-ligase